MPRIVRPFFYTEFCYGVRPLKEDLSNKVRTHTRNCGDCGDGSVENYVLPLTEHNTGSTTNEYFHKKCRYANNAMTETSPGCDYKHASIGRGKDTEKDRKQIA